jgi:bifunctional DNase/RNase
MKKIELEIVALSHSVSHSHNYAVVLGEVHGSRRLPIVIGAFEAQAIAVAMERMAPNRPLTHDLFKNTLQTFGIELKEIIINNLLDGIFYSKMVCVRDGESFEVDSRTSDALAMAVRYECPIYTYEFILEVAGVVLEESEPVEEPAPKKKAKKSIDNALSQYSYLELSTMLEEVLANENYERAAEIRDELNKRDKEL